MKLSPLTAAALAAALLAAACVLVFSAKPRLFVWAAFIGWSSYDQSGATAHAVGTLPLNSPLPIAIAAAVASLLIVLASTILILEYYRRFCSPIADHRSE